jgi:hypothetical protein
MKRILIAALLSYFATAAVAQDTCASKAVDKNGKALSDAPW